MITYSHCPFNITIQVLTENGNAMMSVIMTRKVLKTSFLGLICLFRLPTLVRGRQIVSLYQIVAILSSKLLFPTKVYVREKT